MKNKVFKILTPLVLVVLLVATMVPLFGIGAAAAGETYELVTDASGLAADDKVVIVAVDSAYALSTTQNKNNRGQAEVTKTDSAVTFNDGVQILTLEAGTKTGTFAFNTGNGYLYAASSSSNYLKTEANLSDNSSWTIEIADSGVATIKAQGTNTRNWLRHNDSNNIFSCYGSGQKDIALYKLKTSGTPDAPPCEHVPVADAYKAPTCTETGRSEGSHCELCGETIVAQDILPATGHTFVNGVCTECGEEAQTYTKVTTAPADWSGKYLIVYSGDEGNLIFDSALTTYDTKLATISTTLQEGKIIGNYSANVFTIEAVTGGYSIKGTSGNYFGKDNKSNGVEQSTTALVNTLSLDADGNIIIAGASGYVLRFNASSDQMRFRYYATSSSMKNTIALYKLECAHANTETTPAIDPTCTVDGRSEGKKCLDCGTVLSVPTTVPATGHNDTNGDGVCDNANCPNNIPSALKPADGKNYAFYYQEQIVSSTATARDIRVICVMNEQWLRDLVSAEITIPFADADGIVAKTLKVVPNVVYSTIKADGKTYTAAKGYVILGWIIQDVPTEYAPSGYDIVYTETPENIVKAAYNLGVGETLGVQTLTGEVISIDTEYDASFGNITVTIVVAGLTDNPIQCYRLICTAETAPVIGDVITVTGTIKNFNNIIEFDSKCTFVPAA